MDNNFVSDIKETKGSFVTGIIGALLGAIVGAIVGTILWLQVITSADYFVGLLGFAIALASMFGYKLLRGRKNTAFAMTTIIISSILAVIISEFAAAIVAARMNDELMELLKRYEVSLIPLMFDYLLSEEMILTVGKDILIGIGSALLEILSIRKLVLPYTDPKRAAEERAAEEALSKNRLILAKQVDGSLDFPESFTVSAKTLTKVVFTIISVFWFLIALACFALPLVDTLLIDEELDALPFCAYGLFFAVAGLFFLSISRRKITVNGTSVTITPMLKSPHTVDISEIHSVTKFAHKRKLIDVNGKVIATFNDDEKNSLLFLQFLEANHIEIH